MHTWSRFDLQGPKKRFKMCELHTMSSRSFEGTSQRAQYLFLAHMYACCMAWLHGMIMKVGTCSVLASSDYSFLHPAQHLFLGQGFNVSNYSPLEHLAAMSTFH